MVRTLFLTLALAALVAALPAASLAQDAGSNQYQDPLAGEPGSGSNNGNGNSGGNGGGGGGGGGTANTSPSSGTQGAATTDGTTAAQSRDQLPATGSDAWLLALAGAMLLGGGLGLRRVTVRPQL